MFFVFFIFLVFASSEPVPGFQGDTLQLAFIDLRQVNTLYVLAFIKIQKSYILSALASFKCLFRVLLEKGADV